jgi:DNA polymerase III epsilon subunit-like protein
MYKCTLDCETTGLINLESKPSIIQLSFCISKFDKIIKFYNYYIKVLNYNIPENHISKIHNSFLQNGIDINTALIQLYLQLNQCDLIIGHNIQFDVSVILIEIDRLLQTNPENLIMLELQKKLQNFETFDTMLVSYNLLNLNKYPKLTELYKIFFNSDFIAHNSVYDVISTFQIFCKIVYNV